jgi:hypothetical protein
MQRIESSMREVLQPAGPSLCPICGREHCSQHLARSGEPIRSQDDTTEPMYALRHGLMVDGQRYAKGALIPLRLAVELHLEGAARQAVNPAPVESRAIHPDEDRSR